MLENLLQSYQAGRREQRLFYAVVDERLSVAEYRSQIRTLPVPQTFPEFCASGLGILRELKASDFIGSLCFGQSRYDRARITPQGIRYQPSVLDFAKHVWTALKA